MEFGIDAIDYYLPNIALPIVSLAEKRDIIPAKLEKGLGLKYMGLADVNEDTASMAARKEKQQRNKLLLSKLRARGYSVTSIKGSYIENYGTPNAREVGESSFFVADLQDKGTLLNDLKKFGKEFDQDSILFGKAGSGLTFTITETPIRFLLPLLKCCLCHRHIRDIITLSTK